VRIAPQRSEAAAILARAARSDLRERFTLTLYNGTVTVDTDALASEVFALTNELRKENGLAPLTRDDALDRAAALRAAELAEKYSHTRPNGKSCFSAFDECKVDYTVAGENIAAGYITAADVCNAWAESEGHFENICGDYERLAISCFVDDAGMIYWVQLFAK